MAEPIDYTPTAVPVAPQSVPRHELRESTKVAEIIQAVRGGGADALAVVLDQIDSPSGRAAITRIAKLSLLTGSYTPLLVERLADGIKATSSKVASADVPSWRELARQLRLPSTRRGIGVVLALLRALGGEEF
jgi:uncharacterized protein YjgD (DUF1641 family)